MKPENRDESSNVKSIVYMKLKLEELLTNQMPGDHKLKIKRALA